MSDEFARLRHLFHQVNTHLTFLSSHSRSTIPTYELLHKLNLQISKLDLAIFTHILPQGDVDYQYVDEMQVSLLLKEKIKYDYRTGYKLNASDVLDAAYEVAARGKETTPSQTQLLIFDFKDVKTHGIGGAMMRHAKRRKVDNETRGQGFFLSSAEMSMLNLSNKQIMAIVISRDKKFDAALNTYIKDRRTNGTSEHDIYQNLVQLCQEKVPKIAEVVDPMMEGRSQHPQTLKPTIDGFMDILKEKKFYKDQIIHSNLLTESSDPIQEPLSIKLHPHLVQALQNYKGITPDKFYSHQKDALEALSEGCHVIVSTATSSGKSLIYQVPILNEILWDGSKKRNNTAIFVFPTKALAQDQKRHLQELIEYIPTERKIIVDTFDGDTPSQVRTSIRQTADIIFTNPDAIHAAILPNYNKVYDDGWIEFLGNLRYIALDEIHVYKGTFGVNVCYVLRRLNRLVNHLGGTFPQYISCSATIINPDTHFRVLCGLRNEKVVHVSRDGSPKGNKMFLIWQPPAVMNKKGQTVSQASHERFVPRVLATVETARLLLHLISCNTSIKVIVFCSIRKICELLMREIRLLLPEYPQVSEGDIMSYRGGYLKLDRRKIELRMFNGELRAIIATNALELGIDLSELDVVISCGYQFLKANMHQQFGRAGRTKNSNSLAIYVCGATAIDMHYVSHPEELHGKDYEDLCIEGMVELLQMLLMELHLQCAAFELPISIADDIHWFVGENLENEFVRACRDNLVLLDGYYRTSPKFLPWPAELVSIRAVEQETYAVVDITNGKNDVIEEVESLRTSFTLYEGGIFLHQGLPYLVKEFNVKGHFAKVERVQVEWLTQQRDFTDIEPTEIEVIKCLHVPGYPKLDIPVFFGKIDIKTTVFGFFKVNRRGEMLEAVEVDNPPVEFKSKGFWLDIPRHAIKLIKEKSLNAAGGIHAAQHAIMNILPLFISGGASTNPNVRFNLSLGEAELRTECKAPQKEFAQRQSTRKRPPRLIFHDSKGGERGTGMSAKTFEHIDRIIFAAYQRIDECECEWGCPCCVHASFCAEMLLVILKPAALIVLGSLIGYNNEFLDNHVRDGPEANLPNIRIETIEDTPLFVKMAPDVQVISVREILPEVKCEVKEEDTENNEEQHEEKNEDAKAKANEVIEINDDDIKVKIEDL